MIQSSTAYDGESFSGARVEPGEVRDASFFSCEFKRCVFQGVSFQDCRFVECRFEGSDLSLVGFPGSSFSRVIFLDSKITGVNWARADWSTVSMRDRIEFVHSFLDHSTFLGLSLPGLIVRDCQARGVDFREADLEKSSFSGTDLENSLFGNTNLSGADLSRARNYQIHPGKNKLVGAKFSLPEALSLLVSLEIELVPVDEY